MTDINPTIQKLLEANPLREPVLQSAIQALQLPRRSCGLDVGCGIGLQALSLAEWIGPGGRITGLDLDPELLVFGEELLKKAGLSEQIKLQVGDMNRLPFSRDSFDWAWSADCVGYPIGDLTWLLEELARVVRPGGRIIILGWSSQQLLPGYPLLEARLNATCSSYAPYLKGKDPERHFMRALRWFDEVGLVEFQAQTFVGEVHAPLSRAERIALASLFEMLWGTPLPETSPEDWREYQRLCQPGSPDFILDLAGYYAFFTVTLFQGKVPCSSDRGWFWHLNQRGDESGEP